VPCHGSPHDISGAALSMAGQRYALKAVRPLSRRELKGLRELLGRRPGAKMDELGRAKPCFLSRVARCDAAQGTHEPSYGRFPAHPPKAGIVALIKVAVPGAALLRLVRRSDLARLVRQAADPTTRSCAARSARRRPRDPVRAVESVARACPCSTLSLRRSPPLAGA